MSIYQKLGELGKKLNHHHTLFKYGFNLSPMYRRSTGRIIHITRDLKHITIKVRLSWKNRNYVNSIFGGSLFSAVDPIPMVQLIYLIGDAYVVWDKSAQIQFKRPAKEDLYANFSYTDEELAQIKQGVADKNEIEIVKTTQLTNKEGQKVYCTVHKTIYVAEKAFYKQKLKARKNNGKA